MVISASKVIQILRKESEGIKSFLKFVARGEKLSLGSFFTNRRRMSFPHTDMRGHFWKIMGRGTGLGSLSLRDFSELPSTTIGDADDQSVTHTYIRGLRSGFCKILSNFLRSCLGETNEKPPDVDRRH